MAKTDFPPASFTPTMLGYTCQGAFRYWCQTALPLVYDDSLSYYELLNKVVVYLNNVISDVSATETNVESLLTAYNQLQEYVNTYFNGIDIQEEINTKLDEMARSGELTDLISPFIPDLVSAWLNEHITPTTPIIDSTLTIEGAAADAKATGDAIEKVQTALDNTEESLETIIGDDLNVSFTPTINGTNVNGVTATYENGRLKVIGAASGLRYFTCFNGQNSSKTAAGTFSQTLPAGRYIVHVSASGYLSETEPYINWTTTNFSESTRAYDSDIIDSNQPIMVGIRFPYNETLGTESNPGYYDAVIIPVADKRELILSSYVPLIPDNTDINTYTTPGTYRVSNNEHAGTMTNLPVRVAGKLVCLETSHENNMVQIYFIQNMNTLTNIRYRVFDGSNWSNWFSVTTNGVFEDRIKNLERSINIRYQSGSWGDGIERIQVYVPVTDGYIMYRLYHFVNTNDNCDGWQIYHAYHVDDNYDNDQVLTIQGEWECAIKLEGRNDFSGGHTHGDEVMTSVVFLIDGVPVDISTITTMTAVKKFQMIQVSNMYDPNDHTTIIAEHGKELVFSDSKLTVNQSLNWKVAENLDNCFLCMFLPSKNWIDRASANNDFETVELPTETGTAFETVTKRGATDVNMWDTTTGFSADVSVPVYPKGLTGGDLVTISDNGGLNYNKLYFKVCGGGARSTVGERWMSKSIYELSYSE